MANASTILRRARGLAALTDELIKAVENMTPAQAGGEKSLTGEEIKDLWAFHVALSDGVSEAEIRRRDPELYRRLQERYLTQEEMTRDRLNQLPDR